MQDMDPAVQRRQQAKLRRRDRAVKIDAARKEVQRSGVVAPLRSPLGKPASQSDKGREQLLRDIKTWPGPMYAENFPLILLWVHKAGCTTLVRWFLFQTGLLDSALAFHSWPHRYRRLVLQGDADYRSRTVDLLLRRDRPVFKLVRDPWQRAVSSYLQLCASLTPGQVNWATRMTKTLQQRIGILDQTSGLTFRQFAKALALEPSLRKLLNSHIAEQYLPGEEQFSPRLIRLENFATEIRAVEAEFNLPQAPIDQLSQSPHHRGSTRQLIPGAADIPATSRADWQRIAPAYESFYDAEVAELIAQAFNRDFSQYGYAADRIPGLSRRRHAS